MSPGALFDGLTKEEMLEGKSRLRNPLVADVFHKMAIIEKWGTGIRRMFALCRKSGVAAPVVSPGASSVSVCFLRPTKATGTRDAQTDKARTTEKTTEATTEKATGKTADKIVRLMREQPTISMRELAAKCGMTEDGIYWHLKKLKAAGVVRRVGANKGGHWEVTIGKP